MSRLQLSNGVRRHICRQMPTPRRKLELATYACLCGISPPYARHPTLRMDGLMANIGN